MDHVKTILVKISSMLLHLLALFTVLWMWKPFAVWYFNYRPILGVDFYNTVSYVSYLARHFALPVNGWKYIWWTGVPLSNDYPLLHMYLILPLTKFFTTPVAVQTYMLLTTALFLIFTYLLFYVLSKHHVLATVLTVAVGLSRGLYGPLIWGGSLPYYATQMFLPLILVLLYRYFQTGSKKWFYLSSLFLGVSFLGHPLAGIIFISPIILMLLLFYPIKNIKFSFKKRSLLIIVYFVLAIVIGYGQMYQYFGKNPLNLNTIPALLRSFLGNKSISVTVSGGVSEASIPEATLRAIKQYEVEQITRVITDTHPLLINLGIGISILILPTLFLKKKKSEILKIVSSILIPAFYIVYAWLGTKGVNIYHGGWYRVFWPVPLGFGILIASVWGEFIHTLSSRFSAFRNKFIYLAIFTITGIVFTGVGYDLFFPKAVQKMITRLEVAKYRQHSSAFPDSLSYNIEKSKFNVLTKRLVPSWLDPNNQLYRLYDVDQRVTIWWNALFDMPQLRGYIDPPTGDSGGNYYWTVVALTQGSGGINNLVETWKVPEKMAYNNALFLIDWFSIKYIEAEHERSDSYNPLTTYITNSDIFSQKEKVVIPGWANFAETRDGERIKWEPNTEEFLTYYEIKDQYVSPTMQTTNAPTIGIIGNFENYHSVIRSLAALNLNSRLIIPVRLGETLDEVSAMELSDMDMVMLYGYDYKNHTQVWNKLERYVENGGKIFVDTGSDVKQTSSITLSGKYPNELPEFFPIKKTQKRQYGKTWELKNSAVTQNESVNFSDFSPPIIDDTAWTFSVPTNPKDLKENSQVILENKGDPLVVMGDYGKGKVIWSGMNLPYHITIHKNLEEAKFFKNLLGIFIDFSAEKAEPFKGMRPLSEKVVIQGNQAKGVMLRDHNYPGWSAKLDSRNKSGTLHIYRAGPPVMGFMYVKIPEAAQNSFTVTFTYKGELIIYFWTLISSFAFLLVFDYSLLGSKMIVPIFMKIYRPVLKNMNKWWTKDDEDYQ